MAFPQTKQNPLQHTAPHKKPCKPDTEAKISIMVCLNETFCVLCTHCIPVNNPILDTRGRSEGEVI